MASETETSQKNSNKRWFKVKVEGDSQYEGRYKGNSPWQAGNKALSEIVRRRGDSNNDSDIKFTLTETTITSKKKSYIYIGKRVKLDKPVEYTINGKSDKPTVITKSHKNILKKVKKGDSGKSSSNSSAPNTPIINTETGTEAIADITESTNNN